jgi:chaperonin GroES
MLGSARTSSFALRGVSVTIRPLHDRILARRIVAQDTTKGGLFIPDNAKEKPMEALVIAIGSGKLLDNGTIQAITVKAGDKILIGKYTGSEVKLDGQDHIILSEDDVLAVLEG